MLSLSDQSVIDRDPQLPALRWMLDPEAASQWAVAALPDWGVTSAEVTYLRYKPGTSCLARMSLRAGEGERSVYVIAFPDADRAGGAAKRAETRVLGDTLLVPFSVDRRLPGLRLTADANGLTRLLGRLGLVERGDPTATAAWRLAPLRHKPERRFVGMLQHGGDPTAALRLYTPDRLQEAKRIFRVIGRRAPELELLGTSRRHASIATRWVEGKPLSADASADELAAVGRRLARLHKDENPELPTRRPSEWGHRVREAIAAVRVIAPEAVSRFGASAARIERELTNACGSVTTLHGDAHLEQFLVGRDDGEAALIDFDHARQGPREWDMANVAADLYRKGGPDRFGAVLEGYSKEIDRRRLEYLTALRLIELSTEPFRRRAPDWRLEVDRLFDAASNLISKERVGALIPREPRAITDEALPTARIAAEPSAAEAQLQGLLAADERGTVTRLEGVRVLRHKVGRRCLIAYDVQLGPDGVPTTLLGKIEAKNRSQRRVRDQEQLWQSGFDNAAPDGVVVARPWGAVPEWRMWLQERAQGDVLTENLETEDADSSIGRVAQAITKLHEANLPHDRRHTARDEASLVERRLSQAAIASPHLARRLEALACRCRESLLGIIDAPETSIHRDFYSDQVLLDGERVVLLDFDLLCRGDSAIDVGNFIGCLHDHALRNAWPPGQSEALAEQFLLAYAGHGSPYFRHRVEVYTLTTIARHIELAQRLPGRAKFIEGLTEEAESRFRIYQL